MDVKVRRVESVTILELAGSLDLSNSAQIRDAILKVTSYKSVQVVINLRNIYFIDSSGLAALAMGLKRARAHHGNLCLCSLQPPVRMIFEMTRFDKIFEIFVSEEDAVLAAAGIY